jgi:hypothetical protein
VTFPGSAIREKGRDELEDVMRFEKQALFLVLAAITLPRPGLAAEVAVNEFAGALELKRSTAGVSRQAECAAPDQGVEEEIVLLSTISVLTTSWRPV